MKMNLWPNNHVIKNPPVKQETQVQSLGQEKEMLSHSSTLAWEIPWKEEPGGLQSTGVPNLVTNQRQIGAMLEPVSSKLPP